MNVATARTDDLHLTAVVILSLPGQPHAVPTFPLSSPASATRVLPPPAPVAAGVLSVPISAVANPSFTQPIGGSAAPFFDRVRVRHSSQQSMSDLCLIYCSSLVLSGIHGVFSSQFWNVSAAATGSTARNRGWRN